MQSAPRSDASDDEIMQQLATALNIYKSRFGLASLLACLRDLIRTLEDD